MTPYDLSIKVKKVIQMNARDFTINSVYFNPYFLRDLLSKVPELAKAGIHGTVSETETEDGSLVSGKLTASYTGDTLELGNIFLNGETLTHKNLVTIDKLVWFVLHEARKILQKSVQEKEQDKAKQNAT